MMFVELLVNFDRRLIGMPFHLSLSARIAQAGRYGKCRRISSTAETEGKCEQADSVLIFEL